MQDQRQSGGVLRRPEGVTSDASAVELIRDEQAEDKDDQIDEAIA